MARSLPLVLPALMMRVQAAIAESAAAFSSLQTAQSSARADVAAKLNVTLSRSAAMRGRMVFL